MKWKWVRDMAEDGLGWYAASCGDYLIDVTNPHGLSFPITYKGPYLVQISTEANLFSDSKVRRAKTLKEAKKLGEEMLIKKLESLIRQVRTRPTKKTRK